MYSLIRKIARRFAGEISTETLIARGMRVGKNFNRQSKCYIDPTHCFLITIGNNVTMSIRVTLMAHDASTKHFLGYTKIGKITIGDNVFIGANATILPNVDVGDNVIIGANSVVTKSIPDNMVAAGNPARVLCTVDEYKEKNKRIMASSSVFGDEYCFGRGLDEMKKEELIQAVQNGIAFIE